MNWLIDSVDKNKFQGTSCYVLTYINFSVFRAFITELRVGPVCTKQNLVCFAKNRQKISLSQCERFFSPTKIFSSATKLQRCHQEDLAVYNVLSGNKILCSLTATCILSSQKFCLRNPESLALESGIQRKESGIPLQTIGIRNPSSTEKDRNPVPEIQNPLRGIQNPRLSQIPLHVANPSLGLLTVLYEHGQFIKGPLTGISSLI